MHSRTAFSIFLAAALAWLPGHLMRGQDGPAPDAARRHEVWVPSKDLQAILQEHPNAVLLDRTQYEALIRDAGRVKPDVENAPVPCVIEGVKLRLDVAGRASSVLITAKLTVNNLVEAWSQAKLLDLPPGVVLTHIDGKDAASRTDAKSDRALHLLVRGKGRHEIGLQFRSPIQRTQGVCRAAIPLLARPFSISAVAAAGARFHESWPVKDGVATVPVIDARMDVGGSIVDWVEAPPASDALSAITQRADCLTNVRGGELATSHRMFLSSANGPLPRVLRFRFANADTQVTNVGWWDLPGSSPPPGNVPGSVNEAEWKQEDGVLEITRRTGFMQSGWFCFETTTPTPDAATTTAVALEVPRLEGASRVMANLGLNFGETLEMGGWQTPGSAPPQDFIAYEQSQRGRDRKDAVTFLAHYESAPARVMVNIRRAGDFYSADVDLHALVTQHDVQLTRTIAFQGEEGGVQRAQFSLPAGEQFLSLAYASGQAIEWKQTGTGAARALEIAWPRILTKGKTTKLLLSTRKDIPSTGVNPPPPLVLENLAIPGATRLAGYLALDFDESWKVTSPDTAGLESRDARYTPVKGRMAWFHLREYRLSIWLSRHEPVLDAAVTAYALPRARTVEIEGQVVIESSRAPLRSFTVKLPANVASLLRWDSPLIGGRTLDATSGVWTLALRKELLGAAILRWHLSLPGELSAAAPQTPPTSEVRIPHSTLAATLPRFEFPTARRFTGAWVIEANTDTELSFDTKGLQPLDALRAPRVDGYLPRHRVIAAYGYGTAAHELRVIATRHESARLTSAVVEMLTLTSVIARDGTARHEAVMRVRHSGDQFFAVRLPADATLLSASVEHGLVKPVTAGPGEVRVPLPRRQGASGLALIAVLYETTSKSWNGGGKAALQPPAFDAAVPVLTTSWRVMAPDGYSYVEPETTLKNARRPRDQDSLAGVVARSFEKIVSRVDFLPGGIRYAKESTATTAAAYSQNAAAIVIAQLQEQPVKPQVPGMTPVLDASKLNPTKPPAAKSGLLPVKLELPANGRVFEFRGNQRPEALTLRYQSWERQLARASLWLVVGLALFWRFGRERTWWRSLLAALLLTCVPLALLPSWLAVCNALLAGWLMGLAVWLLHGAARWVEKTGQPSEGRALA